MSVPRVLMIGPDVATMKSASQYLVGRGWSASYVTDLYTGIVFVQSKQPTYVIINVSHPSKMIMKIPKFIVSAFHLTCIVCSSESGPRAQSQLQKTGMTAMIHGAASGPSIFLKISDMIKAGQGHLKDRPEDGSSKGAAEQRPAAAAAAAGVGPKAIEVGGDAAGAGGAKVIVHGKGNAGAADAGGVAGSPSSVVASSESGSSSNDYDPNYVKDDSKVKPFLADVNEERKGRGLKPVIDPYKDAEGKPFREPPRSVPAGGSSVAGETSPSDGGVGLDSAAGVVGGVSSAASAASSSGGVARASATTTGSADLADIPFYEGGNELDSYEPKETDLSVNRLLAIAPDGGFVNDLGSGCICRVRSGPYKGFYFVVLGNSVNDERFNLQRALLFFIRKLFSVPDEKSLEGLVIEVIEAPDWSELPVKGVMSRVSCDLCVLMAFLKSDQVTEVLSLNSSYEMVEVSRECLHPSVKISFDLHLHLKKNKKYVHYVNSGEFVTEKKLRNILDNELPIYVQTPDIEKYKDTHIRTLLEKNIKQYKLR